MSISKSLSNYSRNDENPFLNEAVEQIQNNIVKKYKNTAGYGEKAVLQAIDPKLLGLQIFWRTSFQGTNAQKRPSVPIEKLKILHR